MQDKKKDTKTGRAAKACDRESRTAPINMKSSIWRNRKEFRLDRRHKPECFAIRANGKVRIVGGGLAAKWLGISRTTFYAAVIERGDIASETVALVRNEYPELFKDGAAK